MTTALIVLLIAYMIISKIMGRGGLKLPGRPTDRHPGDIEQPRLNYTSSRSEDRPLSGPWDIPARGEDGPLTGPWDKSTHSEDVSVPGQLEPERSTGVEGKPQPPLEWKNEPLSPRRQWEQTNPAVDPPLELDDQDRPRQPLKVVAGGKGCPIDQLDNLLPQPFTAATSRRRKRKAGNPLAAAFRSENALMGSMIIGEVLNSRGGRMKRRK